MIVHGLDGQDELSVTAPSRVISFEVGEIDEHELADAANSATDISDLRLAAASFEDFVVDPENYGLSLHAPESLVGGTAEENATVALKLLSGENGLGPDGEVDPVLSALHDAVVFNTAAALKVYGQVQTLQDGVELAMRAIEEGRGMQTLERVIASSRTHGQQEERDAG
jgi:anthranilate phosphoribosyltransferase